MPKRPGQNFILKFHIENNGWVKNLFFSTTTCCLWNGSLSTLELSPVIFFSFSVDLSHTLVLVPASFDGSW